MRSMGLIDTYVVPEFCYYLLKKARGNGFVGQGIAEHGERVDLSVAGWTFQRSVLAQRRPLIEPDSYICASLSHIVSINGSPVKVAPKVGRA